MSTYTICFQGRKNEQEMRLCRFSGGITLEGNSLWVPNNSRLVQFSLHVPTDLPISRRFHERTIAAAMGVRFTFPKRGLNIDTTARLQNRSGKSTASVERGVLDPRTIGNRVLCGAGSSRCCNEWR